jgi:hypothetical protein
MTEAYRESGSARRRGPVALVSVVPVLSVASIVGGILGGVVWLFVLGLLVTMVWAWLGNAFVRRFWPCGIVIDDDGIELGNIGAHARARVKPTNQAWGRFRVLWADIDSVEIVQGSGDLRPIWNLANTAARIGSARPRFTANGPAKGFRFPEGVFAVYGMRAAMIVHLRAPYVGQRPQYRSVRGQGTIQGRIWATPTRKPDELRAALARFESLS